MKSHAPGSCPAPAPQSVKASLTPVTTGGRDLCSLLSLQVRHASQAEVTSKAQSDLQLLGLQQRSGEQTLVRAGSLVSKDPWLAPSPTGLEGNEGEKQQLGARCKPAPHYQGCRGHVGLDPPPGEKRRAGASWRVGVSPSAQHRGGAHMCAGNCSEHWVQLPTMETEAVPPQSGWCRREVDRQ